MVPRAEASEAALKVAAYQAPLLPSGSMDAVALIRERVRWCEAEQVSVLCCPEAVLGGLADYAPRPADMAIDVESGQLATLLAPLASDTVTTIVGFTELSGDALYNSAAIVHKGEVAGVYRKRHPAMRKSIYRAGDRSPVFGIDGFSFGILICNDSNYPELARTLVSQGARALFIPTNNALPPEKANVAFQARNVDIMLAAAHRVPVIRADVAGRTEHLMSCGSSAIVDRNGTLQRSARHWAEDFVVADLII